MQSITVNGSRISSDQIYQEMQFFPSNTPEAAIEAASRSLVINELLRQRAVDLGLEIDPEECWMDELIGREAPGQRPTEAECRRFYESQPEAFCSSPLAEVRHILLGVSPEDASGRDQRRAEAQALIQRLQESPDDFGRLAGKHSDCPSRGTGGSLGQISRDQTVPEFEKAVFRSRPGLMGRPLETRYGVHVVWVDRLVSGEQLPFEMVRERIETYLQERASRQAISDYLNQLVEAAQIEGIVLSTTPLVQ